MQNKFLQPKKKISFKSLKFIFSSESIKLFLAEKTTVSKKKFLEELWKQFQNEAQRFYHEKFIKIDEPSIRTSNFETDKVKTRFAVQFADYIKLKVEAKISELEYKGIQVPHRGEYGKTSFSATSLQNNYLKVDRLSDDVRDSTVSLICLFLGYNSFQDFQNQHNLALKPYLVKQYLKHRIGFHAAVFFFILIFILIVYLKTGTPNDTFIKEIITKANQIELNSYKRLNLSDTIVIDKYWTKGIARKRIINILTKHPLKGRILIDTLNTSSAKILDFNVIFKSRFYIRVQTEENWKLLWYNTKIKKFELPAYDRVDTQIYELVRDDNQWKILDNWHIKKPLDIDVDLH